MTYEYLKVEYEYQADEYHSLTAAQLTAYGDDGWELVAVVPFYRGDPPHYWFKREVP